MIISVPVQTALNDSRGDGAPVFWTGVQVSGVQVVKSSGRSAASDALSVVGSASEDPEAFAALAPAHHSSKGVLRQVTVPTLRRASLFSRMACRKKTSSSS